MAHTGRRVADDAGAPMTAAYGADGHPHQRAASAEGSESQGGRSSATVRERLFQGISGDFSGKLFRKFVEVFPGKFFRKILPGNTSRNLRSFAGKILPGNSSRKLFQTFDEFFRGQIYFGKCFRESPGIFLGNSSGNLMIFSGKFFREILPEI